MQRQIVLSICFLTGLALAPSAAAANIKISYTMMQDRIRPEPQKNVYVTNSFNVELAEGGAVKEKVNRSAGPFADNFKTRPSSATDNGTSSAKRSRAESSNSRRARWC